MAEDTQDSECFPDTQLLREEEEEEDSLQEFEVPTSCWGRLLSHGMKEPIDLCSEQVQIGRHPDRCDVVVTETDHVSACHCKLSLLRRDSASGHVVQIENQSQNKTFIQQSSRKFKKLSQGETYRLTSGEQVTLLYPLSKRFSTDLLKAVTWTFVNLSDAATAPPPSAPSEALSASAGTASSAGGISEDATGGAASESSTSLSSKVGERYDVLRSEEVGRGQYGVVYKAIERATGEACACKVVDIAKAMLAGSHVDTILSEVEVTKGVNHESIISTKDVFRDDEYVYIIQPLMLGGDLFDRIAKSYPSGYPEASARLLIRQLVGAVGYLHDRDIVHRDIKPENSKSRTRAALISVPPALLFFRVGRALPSRPHYS